MNQRIAQKFSTASFTIISIVCIALPFIFLPGTLSGLGAVKGIVLYAGVLLAATLWLVSQFIEGNITFPKNRAMLGIAIWVVLVLISSLVSKNIAVSLWGRGFAMDSFATWSILAVFSFLIATFTREKQRLIKLFLVIFSASLATVLIQVILYALHTVPFVANSLGNIATAGTVVGSWIDFAYFIAITFLLSLLMYEVLAPTGIFRMLALGSVIICLVALVFLNFALVWIITIATALLVFVYKSSVERYLQSRAAPTTETAETPFPILSFITLLVGLFFLLSSHSIGASLSNKAGISFTTIRPSLSTSLSVFKHGSAKDILLGAGAGRYANAWDLHHNASLNHTVFWNTSFENGYDTLLTMLVTHGILATGIFIAIIISLIISGFKLFSYTFPDRFSRFIAVTALIMVIALVGLMIITTPGIVLITFTFIYIGLLMGVSNLIGATRAAELRFLKDPRTSFFAILMLVVFILGGFALTYESGARFASIVLFNRALGASDFDTTQNRLFRALNLSQNDLFLRTASSLYMTEFNNEANGAKDKNRLQGLFTSAEQSAQDAVSWDPTTAANWFTLGQVYQLAIGGSKDAYTNAVQAVTQAQTRNPSNPVFELAFAQLAMANNDEATTETHIQKALDLKSDYLDAYLLSSQIKRSHSDLSGARDEIQKYVAQAPYDDQGYAILGIDERALKNYDAALDDFSKARSLNPYEPTYYAFYIVTLSDSGDSAKAAQETDTFKKLFPNNVDLLTSIKSQTPQDIVPDTNTQPGGATPDTSATPEKGTDQTKP